jgi:hypothetical protein
MEPKMYRFLKMIFFAMFRCSSNVFFINNPDPNANPDPKLRLKQDLNPDADPKKIATLKIDPSYPEILRAELDL